MPSGRGQEFWHHFDRERERRKKRPVSRKFLPATQPTPCRIVGSTLERIPHQP
jgi:hypothetical protein